MPRLEDDQRDELDELEDEDLEQAGDEESAEDSESDDTETDGEEDSDSKGESKRINDLMSRAQKAEARAAKAEKALAKMRGEGEADPATQRLMSELREAGLDAVFGEHPELREYGIKRDLIEGTTRAELRESAKALVSLIKTVSTKARNKALADAGVEAEPQSGQRRPAVDYGAMSDEDFQKELKRLSGR